MLVHTSRVDVGSVERLLNLNQNISCGVYRICRAALGGALGWQVAVNFAGGTAGWGDPRLWAGMGVISVCVLLHTRLRLAAAAHIAERSTVSDVAMWCASALVMTLLYFEIPEHWLSVAWAALALMLLKVGLREHALS